jgi:hypothetical protein
LLVEEVMELLNICLTTAFFPFENKYYQRKDPMAVGNSLFPVVTVILMFIEHFEEIALETEEHNPAKCLIYVEDTSVVWPHEPAKLQQFLCRFNSLRPTIIFTANVFGRFGHEEGS